MRVRPRFSGAKAAASAISGALEGYRAGKSDRLREGALLAQQERAGRGDERAERADLRAEEHLQLRQRTFEQHLQEYESAQEKAAKREAETMAAQELWARLASRRPREEQAGLLAPGQHARTPAGTAMGVLARLHDQNTRQRILATQRQIQDIADLSRLIDPKRAGTLPMIAEALKNGRTEIIAKEYASTASWISGVAAGIGGAGNEAVADMLMETKRRLDEQETTPEDARKLVDEALVMHGEWAAMQKRLETGVMYSAEMRESTRFQDASQEARDQAEKLIGMWEVGLYLLMDPQEFRAELNQALTAYERGFALGLDREDIAAQQARTRYWAEQVDFLGEREQLFSQRPVGPRPPVPGGEPVEREETPRERAERAKRLENERRRGSEGAADRR
jgi:hypothetical protein